MFYGAFNNDIHAAWRLPREENGLVARNAQPLQFFMRISRFQGKNLIEQLKLLTNRNCRHLYISPACIQTTKGMAMFISARSLRSTAI